MTSLQLPVAAALHVPNNPTVLLLYYDSSSHPFRRFHCFPMGVARLCLSVRVSLVRSRSPAAAMTPPAGVQGPSPQLLALLRCFGRLAHGGVRQRPPPALHRAQALSRLDVTAHIATGPG